MSMIIVISATTTRTIIRHTPRKEEMKRRRKKIYMVNIIAHTQTEHRRIGGRLLLLLLCGTHDQKHTEKRHTRSSSITFICGSIVRMCACASHHLYVTYKNHIVRTSTETVIERVSKQTSGFSGYSQAPAIL